VTEREALFFLTSISLAAALLLVSGVKIHATSTPIPAPSGAITVKPMPTPTQLQAITFQNSGGNMPGIIISNNDVEDNGPGCSGITGPCLGNSSSYNNQIDFEDFSQGADGVHIINNIIKWAGGWNLIQVHYDTGSVLISGNTVGPGGVHGYIDTKGVGSPTHQAIVRNNTIIGGVGAGLEGWNSTGGYAPGVYIENTFSGVHANVLYEFNTIYDIALGMQYCPGEPSGNTTTAKYYNNTVHIGVLSVHQSDAYAFYANCGVDAGQTLDIRNNIFDGGGTSSTGTFTAAANTYTEDYNNIGGHQGNKGYSSNGSSSLAAHDQNAVNPLYTNEGGNDFTLQAGSPDIHAGLAGLTTSDNIGAW
jgi:hypothetical protein